MKKYFTLIYIFLIFSCSSRNFEGNIVLLDFTNPQLVDEAIQDWIQIEESIQLNIPDSILVGKVIQLEFTESELYVLENGINSSILIFDRKGSFQKQLLKLGNGPGEYSQIDFFILTENSILVYDRSYQKLITYSLSDLSVIQEYKANDYYMGGFGSLADNNLFLVLDTELEAEIYKGYGFFTSDFKQINLNPQFSGYIEAFLTNSISYFDQQPYLVQPFSEKVYQIGQDSLFLSYQIDFGKNKIPKEVSEVIEAEEFYDILGSGSYYFAVHNLLIKEDYVAFNFYNKNIDNINFALIQNDKVLRFPINSNLEELFLKPLTVREGKFQNILLPGEYDKEIMSMLSLTEINYEKPILVSYFISE